MKKKLIFTLAAFAFSYAAAFAQGEARLLRFPTTNGSEIVFSYAGDLYKVPINGGAAVRLTSHVGYEMFPHFSPDGKTIAFTGQYDGNTEVYTIPSTGGEPLRLTYTATNQRDDVADRMGPNNIVTGWTVDGRRIIYRNRISSGFAGRLHTVSMDGGLSEVIPLPEGGFNSYSPDGKKLAYNRVMREFRTWKYYTGGMADDIWVYDPAKESVDNITNNNAQDIMPMWIGDNIFFISDRDRTMNIFVYNTTSGQTEKVTDFKEYDVKFPTFHGNTIVFENGGYVYKMDANERKPLKVSVTLASDNIYARAELRDGSRYVRSVAPSPDGKRVVVTARGDIFDVPADKGVTRNITRTPGAHERSAKWSSDGKYIAYISDRTGETEIYLQAAAGGDPVQATRNTDTYIRDFSWSPDAGKIVYTDRKNRIMLLDVASRKTSTLVQAPEGEIYGVNFSPDSKWLTYARRADNRMGVVYVYDIAGKKEHAVTDKWYSSSSPVFSTDGKYIVFVSARDFNPTYGSTEWNHVYNNMNGVYLAILSESTPSPFLPTDSELTTESDSTKTAAPARGTARKTAADVKIDFDGLADRIVRIPGNPSSFRNLYSDGAKVYYYQGGRTRAYDLKRQREEEVAEASMNTFPGSKKAVFSRGQSYYVADIPASKANLTQEISMKDIKLTIDYGKEWAQIFDEAWRAYRDGFYVENLHGVNWKAMKEKYAVLLPYVKTRTDLNYLIGEMIGELNVGHAYINPGEMETAERLNMGLLGAEISRDKSGFFRIERILPGVAWNRSLRSPLAEQGIKAKAGDYIVAIDGVPTNSVKDMFSLLVGKANVLTELSLNGSPQLAGAHKVVINPISDEYPLYHHEWVQKNIRKVEEATDGKVGYIYIPDMGPEGLNEFARYFYPQLDKEALIIDDRANGGGNVSPMILERLAREPYRLVMYRGSSLVETMPGGTLVGPKVCLINKYSASDGDLFPWGFRALELGKLIGTRTWGGIVGISGSLPFLDGTDLRVPFMTSYDPKTGDWIIENYGVEPDITVDNDPIKEWNGEDQQLDRAIEEILKDLKNRKPLPGVPAPRNWSK